MIGIKSMEYSYTIANNSNLLVQTDSSEDENDANENVQTIYCVPVRISNALLLNYLDWWLVCFCRILEQL